MSRIAPIENVPLADIYRDFVIDQMGLHYPNWEYDQWLAMDVFDLSLDIEANYSLYIYLYQYEFDCGIFAPQYE